AGVVRCPWYVLRCRGRGGVDGVQGLGGWLGGVGGGLCGLGGCGSGGVFHVGHNLGESFVCSGKDGGEGAEFRAGFQAAPLEILQFAVPCCFFDASQAKLAPDGGGGVGEDRVEEG